MRALHTGLAALGLLAVSAPASAEIIGGVDFPQGAISFADAVVSYTPGTGGLTNPHMGPANALGVPDYVSTSVNCSSQLTCPYVSLGSGGSVVLQFTDNVLTGSDSDALDLWIFEIGPDVEDTFVFVSTDGLDWLDVGKVFGSKSGIDLDAFGYDASWAFSYVKLIDDAAEGATSGVTVGADIDAVGAISTRRADPPVGAVPEPATWALMMLGFGLIGGVMRTGRRRDASALA